MKPRNLLWMVPISLILATVAVMPAHAELRIGGFTDFTFYATDDSSRSGTSSGFKEGQFVLHFNSALGDRLSFFAELTWTPRASEFGTEVERTILKYAYRDAFIPSVGRYHTPISWWNAAYHHGAWLQTTVDRPIAVRFGSHFLPIHFVGAMAEGRFFPRGFNVSYTAAVGNGRDENTARAGDAGDVNNHRALLGQLGFKPDALYDLEIGGAAYHDRIQANDGSLGKELIVSAFVVLARETPEILGEYFYERHEADATNKVYDNNSWYLQAAYRLPVLQEIFKPYGRFEVMDIASDPFLEDEVQDLRRYLVGIRADVAAMACIKLEGRRYRADRREWVNELFTAVNVVF